MDIITGNRLIANFDSLMTPDDTDEKHDSWLRNDNWIHKTHLKYYTSWDWLMPTVQKIYYLLTVEDLDIPRNLTLNELTIYADLQMIWLAVVEFIKWYNSNQQSQTKVKTV